jgi:hypothetical protein
VIAARKLAHTGERSCHAAQDALSRRAVGAATATTDCKPREGGGNICSLF